MLTEWADSKHNIACIIYMNGNSIDYESSEQNAAFQILSGIILPFFHPMHFDSGFLFCIFLFIHILALFHLKQKYMYMLWFWLIIFVINIVINSET